MFSRDLGVDMWEAIDAASTEAVRLHAVQPGPGVGGHCLPIDPSYLSWQVKRETGRSFRFVELANDVNDHMPDYVVSRLIEALNKRKPAVNGSRGPRRSVSAYKKNTADVRESPAIRLVRLLNDLGAVVSFADPHVASLPGCPARRPDRRHTERRRRSGGRHRS